MDNNKTTAAQFETKEVPPPGMECEMQGSYCRKQATTVVGDRYSCADCAPKDEVKVISEQEARDLRPGSNPGGWSRITASGTYSASSSFDLSDGRRVECYINFGWPKYFLVPAGYREPESWMSKRGLVY